MLDKEKVLLGVAPIAWTNDDMPDLGKENTFEQCISEMALAGYKGTEIGGKYPNDIDVLKKTLSLRNLQVCNCWFSSFLISRPFEETREAFIAQTDFLKATGAGVIGVSEQSYSIQGIIGQPVFEGKHIMNDKEWDVLCDGLNRLGKIAKDKGMTLTFHHHMGTVVQTVEEIERLMQCTDPEYVNLLFDSGHLSYADEEPLYILEKYAARIKHVHLKDIRSEVVKQVRKEGLSFLAGIRKGTFTVPGDGDVDFEPIFNKLEEKGYQGWVVVEAEQDPAIANPFEYAKKAREYIKEKTGL